jgi:hypothetical protein
MANHASISTYGSGNENNDISVAMIVNNGQRNVVM